ncbi:hypothetical protein [Streptomyces rochei]|uniref:hypothetical protein n=1 Tax=Streptomyces rochei TaxID=1928 RepID=UPI0036347E5A
MKVLVPQCRERRGGAQVLDHGVLVPGSRSGQLSGMEQSALDGQLVGEPPNDAVGVSEENSELPVGCLAQDLAERIDAEGTSVAAADAEDEWREVEGRADVQGLAQQLPCLLAHRADPVGATDHDQRQQSGEPDRPTHRLLTGPPVAVAESECQSGLAELSQDGGQWGGMLPLRQELWAVPGHLTYSCVQREPVSGVGDIKRAVKRRTTREPCCCCCPVLDVLEHSRPSSSGASDRRRMGRVGRGKYGP